MLFGNNLAPPLNVGLQGSRHVLALGRRALGARLGLPGPLLDRRELRGKNLHPFRRKRLRHIVVRTPTQGHRLFKRTRGRRTMPIGRTLRTPSPTRYRKCRRQQRREKYFHFHASILSKAAARGNISHHEARLGWETVGVG